MNTQEYIRLYDKYPCETNPYKGWELDLNNIEEFNFALVKKYPWLKPHNRQTGEVPEHYDFSYTELDEMPRGWRLAFGDQICEEIDQELRKFNFQDNYRITQIKEKYGSLRWYDNGTPCKLSENPCREITRTGRETLKCDWDKEKYILKPLWSDHYIALFDKNVDMTFEEIDAYNLDAVHHYALYEILDECRVHSIIDKYTELSKHICINCGEPAEYVSKGWVSPYCEKCAKQIIDQEIQPSSMEEWFTKIDKEKVE